MKGSEPVGWPALAEIRCSRSVSLEQIAARTRIKVDYLTAIEGGDLAKLPGGIYTTSFIRQYARLIDFPEQDLLRLLTPATATTTELPITCRDEPSGWSSRPRLLRWFGDLLA